MKGAKAQKTKPCGMCLLGSVSARIDQAHDAMAEMQLSGRVQAHAADLSAVRLEEARFWIQRLEEQARLQGAQHRKACRPRRT